MQHRFSGNRRKHAVILVAVLVFFTFLMLRSTMSSDFVEQELKASELGCGDPYSPQRVHHTMEPLYPGTGIQAVLPDEGGDQTATTCFTRSYTDLVYENWPRRNSTKPSISPSGDLHIPPPDVSFFSTRSCHVLPRSFIALLQYWLEHVQLPVHLTGKSKVGPIVFNSHHEGIADRLKGIYNALFVAVVTRRPFVLQWKPGKDLPYVEGFVPVVRCPRF